MNMSVPQLIRKLTLHGVLPVGAVLNEFDSGYISNPPKAPLQAQWLAANQAYSSNPNPARSYLAPADMQPLQGVSASKVQGMLNRIRAYPPFDSHQIDILAVNVAKLVTPQITINQNRAQTRATLQPGMTMDQLFDVAFNPASVPPVITRQILGLAQSGGALMYTSDDEDVRLHHPPQHRQVVTNLNDPQSLSLESACFSIGGGLQFAHAYAIRMDDGNTRLILANGIHRMYAIARAGYASTPLAICNFSGPELPDPFVNLPKGMLLEPGADPPLITDFMNQSIVMTIDYFRTLRTVRFNWNFEAYPTVVH